MKNNRAILKNNAAGFGLIMPLLLIILIGLIVAVAMHLITALAALGLFVLAFILIVFFAGLPDLMRYMRISSM
ncbi:MAG: hypothetical protein ACT4O9_12615 [Blastocatellia bacterium]